MQSKAMDRRRSETVESLSEGTRLYQQDEFFVIRTYVNGAL